MKVRIKKTNEDGIVRLETCGEVKEVLVKEEFLNPGDESVSICFKGKKSSGIIEMKTKELENLYEHVRKRIHLIKGFKVIK